MQWFICILFSWGIFQAEQSDNPFMQCSMIHQAAYNNDLNLLKQLVKTATDANSLCTLEKVGKKTPIHAALANEACKAQTIQFLLSQGAYPSPDGAIPLISWSIIH